jgi:predicted MFS family arabinose efflux permease
MAGEARWRLRPFAAELAAYTMFALGYIGYMTFVIAWMRLNGASTATVIAVWFVLGLATLLAPLLWRKPAEHWPGGRPLAAVMAVLTAGAALPLASAQPAAMLLSAALFGVAMFSAPSSIGSFIKRALPRPAWGSAIATFTVVFAAGQIAGPVAIGWLADRSGSLQVGLAASAGLLALGAVLALAQRDLRHAH